MNKWKAILKRLYTNQVVYVLELDQRVDHETTAEIRKATPENVSDVLAFQEPRYVSIFLEFMEEGETGYLAYLDDECVHRSWVREAPLVAAIHQFYCVPTGEDEAFVHYCETSPKARGKGIFPAVLSEITRDFAHKKRLFTAVNQGNEASLRGFEKAGFKKTARVRILRVFGVSLKKEWVELSEA